MEKQQLLPAYLPEEERHLWRLVFANTIARTMDLNGSPIAAAYAADNAILDYRKRFIRQPQKPESPKDAPPARIEITAHQEEAQWRFDASLEVNGQQAGFFANYDSLSAIIEDLWALFSSVSAGLKRPDHGPRG